MSAHASGQIDVRVVLAEGGVRDVRVTSSRPLNLTRVFIGRPCEEAPLLARRLFSLCGHAQAGAARLAIASAQGQAIPHPLRRSVALSIVVERCFEFLRALLTSRTRGDMLIAYRAPIARAAQAAASLLECAAKDVATDPVGRANQLCPLLEESARYLGIGDGIQLREGSPLDQILGADERSSPRQASVPDGLSTEDDFDVVQAARAEPGSFSAFPRLLGRWVETGAYARYGRDVAAGRGALAARSLARILDFRRSLDAIHRIGGDAAEAPAPFSSSGLGVGIGYGAVEGARGRLYHIVEIDERGRIQRYQIVAPTEWNFHPEGPFVAALRREEIDVCARASIERLAELFDPCVGFNVSIEEAAHA